MKKRKILGFVCAALCVLSTASAKSKEAPTLPEIRQVVLLTEISCEFSRGFVKGAYPEVAIECPRGAELPLQFLMRYPLLSVSCSPNLSVKVEQPFYLRVVSGRAYISTDFIQWDKAENFLRTYGEQIDCYMNPNRQGIVLDVQLDTTPTEDAEDEEDFEDDDSEP